MSPEPDVHDTALDAAGADEREIALHQLSLAEIVARLGASTRLQNAVLFAGPDVTLRSVGDYLDAGELATPILLKELAGIGAKSAAELATLVARAQAEWQSFDGTFELENAGGRSVPNEDGRLPLLAAAFGAQTFAEVTDRDFLSSRLAATLRDLSLSTRTFVAVLADLPTLRSQVLGRYHVGRRTFNELLGLCERQAALGLQRWLEPVFGGETLHDALATTVLSVRLERALDQVAFAAAPFLETVIDLPQRELELRGLANMGVTSVLEFREICIRVAQERVALSSQLPVVRPAGGAVVFVPDRTLAELLEETLLGRTEREAIVLRRRHGLGGTLPETLEQIGASFKITRERIRQIEAKALKEICKAKGQEVLAALKAETRGFWDAALAGPILLHTGLYAYRQRLDGHMLLALSILQMTPEVWLDATALRLPFGWYRDPAAASHLAAVAKTLETALADRPLPLPLAAVTDTYSGDELAAAASLILGYYVTIGYLTRTRPGARLSRAIFLHALLAASTLPVDDIDLVADYRRRRQSDACSVRDAEIVMVAAPHLFLQIVEGRWTALGAGGIHLDATFGSLTTAETAAAIDAAVTTDEGLDEEADDEQATIAAVLERSLTQTGPARFMDVFDVAVAALPSGRSPNSIGPTLLTRRERFVRPLPGVYALHHQLPDDDTLLTATLPYLFNDWQMKFLALARRAGEPWGTFPLWRPAVEFRLCDWGRLNAARDGYSSLLAVASVDEWPVADALKDEWRLRVERDGRFKLAAPPRLAAYQRPPLDRVLAACVYARSVGALNWMAANRIEARRIDAAPAAGLMATLVLLGALRPPPSSDKTSWQLPHAATPLTDELEAELSRAFAAGPLTWDTALGAQLVGRMTAALEVDLGWIDRGYASAMIEGHTVAPLEPAAQGEDLMTEGLRLLDAQRREEALQWLLAG